MYIKMAEIGIVINYCSNERSFLLPIINECLKVTKHIAICYGDKLYDNTPEESDVLLEYCKFKYPSIKFLQYKVDITTPVTELKGVVRRPTAYWCNLARWLGYSALKTEVDWIMFLDADEIPDGERMHSWLLNTTLDKAYNYKLANYWYFKLPIYQAKTHEDSILLVHKDQLHEDSVFHDDERDGILKVSGLPQKRMVMGLDDKPMIHHYSWVRSKTGIATKLRTWAHRDDLFKNVDIQQIVEYIYRNNEVNDCVHNYQYEIVDNHFKVII
jgi:hypothetical protein